MAKKAKFQASTDAMKSPPFTTESLLHERRLSSSSSNPCSVGRTALHGFDTE